MRKRILTAFAVIAIVAGLLSGLAAITMGIGVFRESLEALGVVIAVSIFLFTAMLAFLLFRSGIHYLKGRTKEQAIDVSIAACFVLWAFLLSFHHDSDDGQESDLYLPFSVFTIALAYAAFRAIKAYVVEPEYKKGA